MTTATPADLRRFIGHEERLLRRYAVLAGVVLAFGIALEVVSLLPVIDSNSAKLMLAICAPCVTVLGNVFPAQQIFTQHRHISGLRLLKREWEGPPPPSPETAAEYQRLFSEAFRQRVLGSSR